MRRKIKGDNPQYSAIVFAILLIPSIILTFYVLSKFNLIGISFLLLLILGSLWFTLFGTTVISIYSKGKILWGNSDFGTTTEFIIDILLLILVGLVFLGTQFIPGGALLSARYNLLKSFFFGFIISTISIVPFVIVVWIVLQFYS